jgi:hypothetical protein
MRFFSKTILALSVFIATLSGAALNARADILDGRTDEPRARGFVGRDDAIYIVHQFYRAFLFRGAEPAGLRHHVRFIMQNGEEGIFITARNFALSQEFQQNVQGMRSPREIVNNIYRVLFQRAPDPAAQGWVRMIRQGQAGQVAEGIARLDEFRQNYLY